MNCACAYNHTAEVNLLILLLLLRTALAPYWQSLVHLNCACVYYNTLLLHMIEKIKMAGSIREMSSEMIDNHGNIDLFRLDSRVRRKTRICAEVTWNRICANAHNSGNYETRLKCSQDWSRLGFVSALSRLRLGFVSASSRLRLAYASTTPWLRSPASIGARRVITLIMRLGT